MSRKTLARLYANGEWFRFPIHVLGFASPWEAILLSYLINIMNMVRAEERKDGWFYRLASTIERDLHMNADTQKRTINSLKEKGLLKVERRGLPSRRFFWIDLNKLDKLIEQYSDDYNDAIQDEAEKQEAEEKALEDAYFDQ